MAKVEDYKVSLVVKGSGHLVTLILKNQPDHSITGLSNPQFNALLALLKSEKELEWNGVTLKSV